jgi:hypothetical protein
MTSSRMLRHVALIRTDVLEEHITSIVRVTRIGMLGITLAVTSNWSTPILVTLMMGAIHSSETPVLTRATQCNIPEDCTLEAWRCFYIFGPSLGLHYSISLCTNLQKFQPTKLQLYMNIWTFLSRLWSKNMMLQLASRIHIHETSWNETYILLWWHVVVT